MAVLWSPELVYDQTQDAYWRNELVTSNARLTPVPPADLRGSHMTCRFARTVAAGASEDFAEFGVHWAVSPIGVAPLVRLDAASASAVEQAVLNTWFTGLRPHISSQWQFTDFVWRHWGADQPLDDRGYSRLSPVWRITSAGPTPGTNSNPRLPDQVALTTTFRTCSRPHWGRFYTGGWATNAVAASLYGQAGAAVVDALSDSFRSTLTTLNSWTQSINLWVWSAKYRGALSVTTLSVDSVPDVIRSRRAKTPNYRKTHTN